MGPFLTARGGLRWCFGPWSAAVLNAIEAAGFPVDWQERHLLPLFTTRGTAWVRYR